MIYLLKGEEKHALKNEIANILNKGKIKGSAVFSYDGNSSTFSLRDLNNELFTYNFFADKKAVILKDPLFLTSGYKDKEEKDLEIFYKYIDHPSEDIELIIYAEALNFDSRLNNYKRLSKNARVLNFDPLSEYNFKKEGSTLLKRNFAYFDNEMIDYLLDNADGKLTNLHQDIEVLKLYPDKLDLRALKSLIALNVEGNVFKLTAAILNKDLKEAKKIIDDFLYMNVSVPYIIASIASQFRFMNSVRILLDKGLNNNEIMNELNIRSEYRLNKTFEAIRRFHDADYLKILYSLALFDERFKSGDVIDTAERLDLLLLDIMGV